MAWFDVISHDRLFFIFLLISRGTPGIC